jgi:hypothetical protein
MKRMLVSAFIAAALFCSISPAQEQTPDKMYWGDEVPPEWNGAWPAEHLTVPEKTGYTRTTSVRELHEFISLLKWNSENVHVFDIFTSPLRNVSSAVVLANPRVTTPQQAKDSGKPVIYLQGSIHPPESEGTEALLMVMREILMGDRKDLLDNQILIVAPIFNVDGTETVSTRDGLPHMAGTRQNAGGFDLNRDGVKLETLEVNALYTNVFNPWDPVLIYDAHRMGGGNAAYANAYANSTVPAAHPAPRGYVWDTLFPEVRARVRKNFGVEVFSHALFDKAWPPTTWSHDAAIWSVEAKFVVSNYGLRNRMSILTETPGRVGFERQIFGQYAYIMSLLEFTNARGREMAEICRKADEETVARVKAEAESGRLRNWVEGRYESRGKIDLLAYRDIPVGLLPGTSVRGTLPDAFSGPPEIVRGVEDLTKPVGTRDAAVPRGYLIPADMTDIVAKLKTHNIRVEALEKPMTAEGEQFVVNRMSKIRRGGYDMTVLKGGFFGPSVREFPAGTFYLDMAQPMANAAFYYLEPESMDGFVGWGVLDAALSALGADVRPVVYPIFKFRKEVR